MNSFTPQSIRINLGLSRDELANEIKKITGTKINGRMIQDRELGYSKWTVIEIMALAKIANIKDINMIHID